MYESAGVTRLDLGRDAHVADEQRDGCVTFALIGWGAPILQITDSRR
jgi:hypothetical protein